MRQSKKIIDIQRSLFLKFPLLKVLQTQIMIAEAVKNCRYSGFQNHPLKINAFKKFAWNGLREADFWRDKWWGADFLARHFSVSDYLRLLQ